MPTLSPLLIASLAAGFLSAALATWAALSLLSEALVPPAHVRPERTRRSGLDAAMAALGGAAGRWLVERRWLEGARAAAKRNLVRAGRANDSEADFVGGCAVGATIVAAVSLVLGLASGFPVLAIPGCPVLGLLAFEAQLHLLGGRADERVRKISRRLPYAVDTLVLVVEAGAGFEEGLATLVREAPAEPLHQEFDQVLRDRQLGEARRDALRKMAERVGTEEMAALVLAMQLGDELGTPVTETLRTQADSIRALRMERAERLAREAGPKMLLPNTLIVMACLLLVLGPFVPRLLREGGGF